MKTLKMRGKWMKACGAEGQEIWRWYQQLSSSENSFTYRGHVCELFSSLAAWFVSILFRLLFQKWILYRAQVFRIIGKYNYDLDIFSFFWAFLFHLECVKSSEITFLQTYFGWNYTGNSLHLSLGDKIKALWEIISSRNPVTFLK